MTTDLKRVWCHDLKVWQEPFQQTWDGDKPFEVRRTDDRDFQKGDIAILREVMGAGDDTVYTGRLIVARITSIVTNRRPSPLPKNLAVLGLDILHLLQTNEPGTARVV